MNEGPVGIVAALLERWRHAYAAHDIEGLVDLYAEQCFLFGSKPALSNGRAAVRDYFSTALPDAVLRAEFGVPSVRPLGPTVIVSAGLVDFFVGDAPALRYRISLTMIRAEAGWQIASQHASPVPSPSADDV